MKTATTEINRKLLIAYCILLLSFIPLFTDVSVKAQGTVMALAPSSYTAQKIGEEFSINITIANVQDLWSWKVGLAWDPNVLSLVSEPVEGPFLKSVGLTLFVAEPVENGAIRETLENSLPYSNIGASGSGVLATLVFRIDKESYLSPITLDNSVLLAPSTGGTHSSIDHQVNNATVTLGAEGIRAIAGGDQTVNESEPVTLNASRTLSSEQNLTFTWTFVDRKPVTLKGIVVTYVFSIPGVYPVNLTVTDQEGRTSTDSINITVRDITPPVAVITLENISPSQKIEVGQSILFNGTRSYDPKNGTITEYLWNFGDGMNNSGPSLSHTYASPGTYNVNLTVIEDNAYADISNSTVVMITVVRANHPLSPFSYVGGLLIAVTAMVFIALPFWIGRIRRKKATNWKTNA
jgi:PKD repeat protein